MSAKGKFAITLGLGFLLLILCIAIACGPQQAEIQPMGVTNLDSLHLSDTGATATPVLMVNQDGTGRIAEFQDAGTPVFAIEDGGIATGAKKDYTAKTADYTITIAESGALFSNGGATKEITYTLPSAAEGLNFCFYVYAAYTVNVDVASGDQTHHLTNAAGDRIQNTGTAGDSVCLMGADATYWIPTQEIGTWSDAN